MPNGDEERVVAALFACLALVRPVGMSDGAAKEWVKIATGRVKELPAVRVVAACAGVQRECSHHARIVPMIFEQCQRMAADDADLDRERSQPRLPPPERKAWYPTLEEIADNERWLNTPGEAQSKLRAAGLKCGALRLIDGRAHYISEVR